MSGKINTNHGVFYGKFPGKMFPDISRFKEPMEQYNSLSLPMEGAVDLPAFEGYKFAHAAKLIII
jgi:hypothetical protein